MSAPIDKSAWSKSSQHSSGGHYDERATEYENIAYRCKKCFANCIFTAEAQKEAYEIRKKFVWWLPSLCAKCEDELSELLKRDRDYQEQWKANKTILESDPQFLSGWMAVLRAIPSFGKRANSSMEVMLGRCLERITDA